MSDRVISKLGTWERKTGQSGIVWHFTEPKNDSSAWTATLCGRSIKAEDLSKISGFTPVACRRCQARAKKILEGIE